MATSTSQAKSDPRRWESAIAAFEARDLKSPPPADPILFVGSSTIRLWKVADAFPGLPVINRGFGGSQTSDVVHYYDRIIKPYAPRLIVFYSGDNDLAGGKTPGQVAADVQQMMRLIRRDFPKIRVILIGIKPSASRIKLLPQMRMANVAIRGLAVRDGNAVYIDLERQVMDADGSPRPELFLADKLHLSEAGYAILNEAVGPYLGK